MIIIIIISNQLLLSKQEKKNHTQHTHTVTNEATLPYKRLLRAVTNNTNSALVFGTILFQFLEAKG